MAKSIQDIISSSKQNSKNVEGLGIEIPELVSFSNNNSSTGPMVYTTIEIIDEGTRSTGKPIPTSGNNLYCLPPPIQILDLHSANWEAYNVAAFSKLKFDIRNAYNNGVPSAFNLGGMLADTALQSTLQSIINAGSGGDPGANLLTAMNIDSQNLYNIFTLGSKTGINPNTELTYRGANLRTIQLNYRLVPLSQKNANQISKFLDKLKLLMYSSVENNFVSGYPARFIVKIKTNNSIANNGEWSDKILFSIGNIVKTEMSGENTSNNSSPFGCALIDFQVSYGEEGVYSGHYDSSPGIIDLNLTFQETALSTRESIKQEYKL